MKNLRNICVERLTEKLFHPEWGTMDLYFWLPLQKKKGFLDMKW